MAKLLIIGGLPVSLVNFRGTLIRELVGRGHEVLACAGGEDVAVADSLHAMGARYLPLPLSRTGTNPLADLGLLHDLVLLFRHERPDVVLAYTAKPVIYGLLAAAWAKVPHRFAIITGLGYAFMPKRGLKHRLVGWLVPRLYSLALARCEKVFFQNPDDRNLFITQKLLRRPEVAVRVNGSGVDLDHFACRPLPASPPVFLLIARLLSDKGIREFAEAAKRLKQRYADAQFWLLGPYDSNPAAISAAEMKAWEGENAIRYLGAVQDVRPYLESASVYVLPSYREGMPRTVLEAMAVGRAIITTDVPGCRETVQEGYNGFLVPVRDAESLAGAMEKFVLDPALAVVMGERSRKAAEELFDVRKINGIMLEAMGL